MEIIIAIAWPLTVLAALYAGYRWGAKAKAKVLNEAKEVADNVKGAVTGAAEAVKKKIDEV